MQSLESYKKSIEDIYRRSFFRGIGSVFSIPGNYFPAPDLSHPKIKDLKAMKSDWESVGSYLWQAIDKSKY